MGILTSFLIFSVGMSFIIGLLASKKSEKSERDYFIGGQNLSPYVLALSSSASKFSGFMFAGFMSLAYISGTACIWLGLGLVIGNILVYGFTVKRIQDLNTGGWALSVAELVTFWNGENRVWLRRFMGFITLFFLAIYAAAQLKAAGRILEISLDQPVYVGIILSTIVIAFYCWSGGIRASIWTDVAQVVVMTLSLAVIFIVAAMKEGGLFELLARFMETAPLGSDQVKFFPKNLSVGGWTGWILYLIGGIGVGICSLGQPHILIRPMALKGPSDVKKFVITNYLFEFLFIILVILVGLSTRVILKDVGSFDGELALFKSALVLLPPAFVGFVLAGAFSSTLSTADSQILSCSSSLLRDIPEPPRTSLAIAKMGTIGITVIATIIALFGQKNIFSLVLFAFSGLGASIGSVLILRMFNSNISQWGALGVALTGGLTVVLWDILGMNSYMAAGIPGFAAAFLFYGIVTAFSRIRSHHG